MNILHGGSKAVLEDAMRFRVARGAVLAGNLANVDTPGFRSRDLEFVDALKSASNQLEKTHSRHLNPGGNDPASRHHLELGPKGTRPDGNGVNLDEEVIRFHRNTSAFTGQSRILARMVSLTRTAISGGG